MKTVTTHTTTVIETYDSFTETTETSEISRVDFSRFVSVDEMTDEQRAQAYQMWREEEATSPYFDEWTSAEIVSSMEALVKQCGFTLKEYRVDLMGYSFLTVDSWSDYDYHVADRLTFRGRRALAWFENTVAGPLRIPWNGPGRQRFTCYSQPGMVATFPLTGVCYDNDAIEFLRNSLASGATVKEAVESLAVWAARTIEAEQQWALSETAFLDESNGGGRDWQLDEEGDILGMC